jgi:hypothetical protein
MMPAVLLGCSSTPPPSATPGMTGAITRVGDDFLELAGGDIFGDVAAGGGSVWVATMEGLIQVDPATMEATWHTDLAPGKKIVYAFDSVWVGGPAGVVRVDPTTLAELATVRISEPEGITADEDSIWTGQHDARVVLRIDPRSDEVVETIDVASPDGELEGKPMGPSVVDGDVWVAMGNGSEVVRIDGRHEVTRIDLEREVLTPAVATPDAIWFSNSVEYDRWIMRIDRKTLVVSSAELPASALPRPVAIGTGIYVDETLWFPTSGGTMVAIDPVTFDVIGTVTLQGSMPRKAVEYDDAVWLVSEFNGSVERIPRERLAEGLATAG